MCGTLRGRRFASATVKMGQVVFIPTAAPPVSVVVIVGPGPIAPTGDVYLVDASGGPAAIALFDAALALHRYTVKKIDASANPVTLVPFGVQTIDGDPNAILGVQYTSVDFVSDGSNWFIL